MQGKRTLWIPGTDHAAIATQSKVEKELLEDYKKYKDSQVEELATLVNEKKNKSFLILVNNSSSGLMDNSIV